MNVGLYSNSMRVGSFSDHLSLESCESLNALLRFSPSPRPRLPSPSACKMAKSRSPSPTPDDPDAPLDLVAFQTSLDDSLTAARSLVSSWLPADLDPAWDVRSTAAGGSDIASLESRSRPAK